MISRLYSKVINTNLTKNPTGDQHIFSMIANAPEHNAKDRLKMPH